MELDDVCMAFNERFYGEPPVKLLSEEMHQRLLGRGLEVIDHQLDNEQLEMNFYPKIKGFYAKSKDSDYYLLVSFQKYQSETYSGLKLLKYVQPAFSFPHQDNHITK